MGSVCLTHQNQLHPTRCRLRAGRGGSLTAPGRSPSRIRACRSMNSPSLGYPPEFHRVSRVNCCIAIPRRLFKSFDVQIGRHCGNPPGRCNAPVEISSVSPPAVAAFVRRYVFAVLVRSVSCQHSKLAPTGDPGAAGSPTFGSGNISRAVTMFETIMSIHIKCSPLLVPKCCLQTTPDPIDLRLTLTKSKT